MTSYEDKQAVINKNHITKIDRRNDDRRRRIKIQLELNQIEYKIELNWIKHILKEN